MAPSITRTLLTALLLTTSATALALPNLNSVLPSRAADANAVGTTARRDAQVPAAASANEVAPAPLPHGWYGYDATAATKEKRAATPPTIYELKSLYDDRKAKRAPAPAANPQNHPVPHGWYGYDASAPSDTKSEAHDHEIADAAGKPASLSVRRSPLNKRAAVPGARFHHEPQVVKREAADAKQVRDAKYSEYARARDALKGKNAAVRPRGAAPGAGAGAWGLRGLGAARDSFVRLARRTAVAEACEKAKAWKGAKC